MPARLANTPDLAGHIRKIEHMHEVAAVKLGEFLQPMEIFTHTNKVDPTELDINDTTLAENHQDNGAMQPLITQPSSPHLLPTDTSDALELPPLRPHIDAGAAARQASMDDLPRVCLMAADNSLFGVYQDWVHQNTGTNLDVGINEDVKWKAR